MELSPKAVSSKAYLPSTLSKKKTGEETSLSSLFDNWLDGAELAKGAPKAERDISSGCTGKQLDCRGAVVVVGASGRTSTDDRICDTLVVELTVAVDDDDEPYSSVDYAAHVLVPEVLMSTRVWMVKLPLTFQLALFPTTWPSGLIVTSVTWDPAWMPTLPWKEAPPCAHPQIVVLGAVIVLNKSLFSFPIPWASPKRAYLASVRLYEGGRELCVKRNTPDGLMSTFCMAVTLAASCTYDR